MPYSKRKVDRMAQKYMTIVKCQWFHVNYFSRYTFFFFLAGNEIGKLIQAEEHATGSVKFSVYFTYIKHATVVLSLLAVLGYSARQALRMGTDYWLATWSEASAAAQSSNLPHNNMSLYDLNTTIPTQVGRNKIKRMIYLRFNCLMVIMRHNC